MTTPQPIRIIEVRIPEYAPAPQLAAEHLRGYDPARDSPLAGLGFLRYDGEPPTVEARPTTPKRRWFR